MATKIERIAPEQVLTIMHPWRTLEDRAPSPCGDKKWRAFLKTLDEDGVLGFYSKSACGVQRYLSNFQEIPRPLAFLGQRFRTVEHAFQAAKWLYAEKGPRNDMFETLAVGGAWGDLPATKIKSKGGARAFAVMEEKLDLDRWNAQSVAVMKAILKARAAVDPLLRSILVRARVDNVSLYHFAPSRRRKEPFWGVQSIKKSNPKYLWGKNVLGKLLMLL